MPRHRAAGLLFILGAAPASVLAQTPLAPIREPAPSVVFAVRAQGPLRGTLAPVDTLRPMSIGTYAKEGAITGGLLGAIGGGLLTQLSCGLSEDATKNCTGGFLIGGVIGGAMGALPGALIGGLFPKYPKNVKLVQPE